MCRTNGIILYTLPAIIRNVVKSVFTSPAELQFDLNYRG